MTNFIAGAAKVDITPALGTIINGDFVPHFARYIHDPLYARALVMQHADVVVAIVIADVCIMDAQLIAEIKTAITEKTGIDKKHLLISGTHTHAAGSVAELLLSTPDPVYRAKFPSFIVEAVILARQNGRSAEIAFGYASAPEHVVCRRYLMKEGFGSRNPVTLKDERIRTNPAGATDKIEKPISSPDTQLSFLAVRGTDGKWIGLVGNYSLHYVGDWENGTISADYFGVFSGSLQKKLHAEDDFIAMMSNGTGGDVNIWDFLSPDRYPTELFEKSKLIGSDLAEKTFCALRTVVWDRNPALAVAYDELAIGIRKPTVAQLESAKKILSETDFENLAIDQEGMYRLYAREQLLLDAYPNTAVVPIQVFKIGYGTIGALSGEIFSETGLWLKENSGLANYFTVSMANGYQGYIPPAHEMESGGYETWTCRSSCLEENAENTIRNALLALIKGLTNGIPDQDD